MSRIIENITNRLKKIEKAEVLFLAVILLIYLTSLGFYLTFSDELDNILGSILINNGNFPYSGFFSHHMPLQYYFGSLITFFTGNNIILFRLVWTLILYVWLLYIYSITKEFSGVKHARIFAILLALSQFILWTNMFLAESFIAYSSISLFVLLFFKFRKEYFDIKFWDILVINFFIAIIYLSSISYIFLSLVFFIVTLFLGFRKSKTFLGKFGFLIKNILIALLPIIGFAVIILLTTNLNAFLFQSFQFNNSYYSQFNPAVGNSLIGNIYLLFERIIEGLYINLTSLSSANYFISFVLILSLILFGFSLVGKRELFLTFGFVLISILISPREGGIGNEFGYVFKGGPFFIFSLYILAANFAQILENETGLDLFREKVTQHFVLGIFGFVIILVSLKGLLISYHSLKDFGKHRFNLVQEPASTKIINTILNENDFAWQGPFEFLALIYQEPQIATEHTFFLMWQGVCPECNEELFREFEVTKPKLVYFNYDFKVWGRTVSDYTEDFNNYLNSNYVHLYNYNKDLKYYYIHRDFFYDLCPRFKQLDYEISCEQ